MLYLFFVHLLINFLFSLVKYFYFFSLKATHPFTLSRSLSLSLSLTQPLILSPSNSFSHPLNTDQIPLIKNKELIKKNK